MDPKYRSAADVVSIWVTPDEAEKFAKDWRENTALPAALTEHPERGAM
jgi:hypothetical protein